MLNLTASRVTQWEPTATLRKSTLRKSSRYQKVFSKKLRDKNKTKMESAIAVHIVAAKQIRLVVKIRFLS